jgi:hypothetical protein
MVLCSSVMAAEVIYRENFWNPVYLDPPEAKEPPFSFDNWNCNYGASGAAMIHGDGVSPISGCISEGKVDATYVGEPINADPEYFNSFERPNYGFAFVGNYTVEPAPGMVFWTDYYHPLLSQVATAQWFASERTGTGGADLQEAFVIKLNGQWYANVNTITATGSWAQYATSISRNGNQWKALNFVPGSSLDQDLGALSVVGGTLADGALEAFGVYIKLGGISGQTGWWSRLDTVELLTPEPATITLLGLGVWGLIRRR